MDRNHQTASAHAVLAQAQLELRQGYAADIVASALHGDAENGDADALFRALVLEEGWDVEKAADAYYAATTLELSREVAE